MHVSVEILFLAHPLRFINLDAFHEGRCVVDLDHERPFIAGSGLCQGTSQDAMKASLNCGWQPDIEESKAQSGSQPNRN